MNISEYQEKSKRTMNEDLTRNEAISNYSMGLAGECGEVVDLLKKYVYHKHPLSVGEMEKELGDVMWYVSALASTFNLDLGNICQKNVEQLKRRYPEKFDAELSRNRNE